MDKTTNLNWLQEFFHQHFCPFKKVPLQVSLQDSEEKGSISTQGLSKTSLRLQGPKTWGTKLRLYGCKRWSFVHFRKMSLKTSKVTKDLHLLELHPRIQGTNGSDGKWRLLQAFQLLCSAISAAAIMPDFPLHCHPRPQCPGRNNPLKKNVDPRCWVHNLLSSY